MNNSSSASVSLGLLPMVLLTGLFVWLKVDGKIDWDWVWVFAPLWISIGLGLIIWVAVIAFVAWVIKH